MTDLTYDSAFIAAASHKRQSWWLSVLRFFGLAEPERHPPKRQAPPYVPKFGDVDARERPKPPPEPVIKFDPIADLKLKFQTLPYGEFIEITNGLGCDPKTAWKWATEGA